ncbi:hypothetical protein [Kineococcus rubinsiae]|uniref:hypothetical protein n=1 Tax=Kineococcus rubinsiae TaxID=2609562 RepID=UPI00142F5041|nr:hypothetical protein [Kineococcus rubinsiae]NIZ93276.1 hypothetical protein [Kineococcus rubinsiae]
MSHPSPALLTRRRRRRRALLAALVALVVVAAVTIVVAVTRKDAPVPVVVVPDPGDVRASDSLVESMGVAVQLYQQASKYDLLAPALGDLGIRHIRTGGSGAAFFRHVNELHDNYGISTMLVMDPREGYTGRDTVTRGVLPVLDAAEGVEGPNEWDINDELEYEGEPWPEGVRTFQDEMFDAVKGFTDDDADVQAKVRALTVLSPTVADPDAAGQLAGVRCDVAAMHSYPGGDLPDAELTSKWMPSALQLCDGKGVVSTESGYCNTLTPSGCTNQGGVSERASAKYALRHYFEYFRAGVERDYLYNLSTDEWDLFLRPDGTRKPAFAAVASTVDLLADPGAVVNPTRFDVTVSGADDVRHVVLQKRDGSYWLALWTNAISYPAGEECCDVETTRDVTVQLPRTMNATVYAPTFAGTTPVERPGAVQTLAVTVPDEVLLVRLAEAPGATSTPVPTTPSASATTSGTATPEPTATPDAS